MIATSVADPTKSATAAVDVSAVFGFIQEYPAGDATPFSMTPVIGTFKPDGSFITTNIIDPGTNQPVTAPLTGLFVSSDALKGVSSMVESDGAGGWYYNIYTANADGSTVTKLTNNEYYVGDAQFTPDNAQIVYVREMDDTSWADIWMMNADGSNQHVVLSAALNGTYAWHPTLSLDGSIIAAEITQYVNEQWYDGIAIMNIDGSNLTYLTSHLDCPFPDGWDETPSLTHDGQQIVFSRYCSSEAGWSESIYVVNTDGTGLKLLYGGTPYILSWDPLPVADKIVFASNLDNPGTLAFDLYSIKLDGTGLTRLTTNTLYDAFNTWWYLGGDSAQTSARSPLGRRMEKLKALQQRRR